MSGASPAAARDAPRAEVTVRCVRAPLGAQISCALPAGIWVAHALVTASWTRTPLTHTLIRAASAAATPPAASLLLRYLYGGRGTLVAGPALVRLGRRPIRAVQTAGASAALDAGAAGAFVVRPAPGWLDPTGSPPWSSTVRARWVVSGFGVALLSMFTLALAGLPYLGSTGVVLHLALTPVASVLVPAVLVATLVGLCPVLHPSPADRLLPTAEPPRSA